MEKIGGRCPAKHISGVICAIAANERYGMAIELKTYKLLCETKKCNNSFILRDIQSEDVGSVNNVSTVLKKDLPKGWSSTLDFHSHKELNQIDWSGMFRYYDIDLKKFANIHSLYCERCTEKYRVLKVFT